MAANPERKLIAEASYTWERFADIARRENPVLEARNEALLSGVIHFRVVCLAKFIELARGFKRKREIRECLRPLT